MLDPEIEITCPGCGRKFKQRISGLKKNARITCPGCRRPITITGDGTDQIDAALKKVAAAFKKIGR